MKSMEKDNLLHLHPRKRDALPPNMKRVDNSEMVRVPIIKRFYEIDGELYYQVAGDKTPKKWKDYTLDDFN